jgi:hypothetical protein
LIHLAAACLNRGRDHDAAARRQAARAVRGLRAARVIGQTVMGIDVEDLADEVERTFSRACGEPFRIELDFEGS